MSLPINQYRVLARLERHSISVPTSVMSTTRAMNNLIERGLVERFDTDRETVFEYALTLDGKETLAQLDAIEAEDIPAEAPDTETLADELPAFCRCVDCNITLQSTESYRCEDCAIKLNPANSLEQRILRGASASAQFSKALSLTDVIGHADVMGLPREDFEQAFMQAGGIIYFDPETDAAPTGPTYSPIERAKLDMDAPLDDTWCYMTMTPMDTCECAWCSKTRLEGEIAALKARVAELEAQLDDTQQEEDWYYEDVARTRRHYEEKARKMGGTL